MLPLDGGSLRHHGHLSLRVQQDVGFLAEVVFLVLVRIDVGEYVRLLDACEKDVVRLLIVHVETRLLRLGEEQRRGREVSPLRGLSLDHWPVNGTERPLFSLAYLACRVLGVELLADTWERHR